MRYKVEWLFSFGFWTDRFRTNFSSRRNVWHLMLFNVERVLENLQFKLLKFKYIMCRLSVNRLKILKQKNVTFIFFKLMIIFCNKNIIFFVKLSFFNNNL